MSVEQGSLTLTRTCRECGGPIPWDGGPGRPRVLCDGCRPQTWAPMRARRINNPVSGKARASDPATSHASAAIDRTKVEERILQAFRQFGWLNCSELSTVIEEYHPTVVSAVSRLVTSGLLVDTGTTRPSTRGRASKVYATAGEA